MFRHVQHQLASPCPAPIKSERCFRVGRGTGNDARTWPPTCQGHPPTWPSRSCSLYFFPGLIVSSPFFLICLPWAALIPYSPHPSFLPLLLLRPPAHFPCHLQPMLVERASTNVGRGCQSLTWLLDPHITQELDFMCLCVTGGWGGERRERLCCERNVCVV